MAWRGSLSMSDVSTGTGAPKPIGEGGAEEAVDFTRFQGVFEVFYSTEDSPCSATD